MRKSLAINSFFGILFICSISANAQQSPRNLTEILQLSLTNVENQFVPAAEAMAADKFDFVPTAGEYKGVRSFAQILKHTAATNMFLASVILEEKPPLTVDQLANGPDEIKGKEAILQYVKDSFAQAHKAIAKINKDNANDLLPNPFNAKGNKISRMGPSLLFIGHTSDEYGQMVEYLRMNGIVPPASRPK